MATNKQNIAQIVEAWSGTIKQLTNNRVNESTPDKLSWMCQYAHNHTMAMKLNEEAVGGVSFPYQTLNNTMGIGNAVPAQFAGQTAADQMNPKAFGSGDKWPALLPMALQVAARTIGFDLVNTVPFEGPTGVLPFLDYVYAGSKEPYGATPAVNGATANPRYGVNSNGTPVNEGVDPAYALYDAPHAFRCKIVADDKKAAIKAIVDEDASTGYLELTAQDGGDNLKVQFIGLSRLNAEPMFKVVKGQTNRSLGMVFGANAETTIEGVDDVTLKAPRLISALEDQIQGFTGAGKYDSDRWSGTFQDPHHLYEPMDRATGEMQYPRQMNLKVFTKFVTVGTQSIAVAVTQEQVQDLQKQWGIDVLKLVENAAINELSQSMNKHILSRLFALGWKNHVQAYEAEGINLNLDLTKEAEATVSFVTYDDNGEYEAEMPVCKPVIYGDFENTDTMYKKVGVNMLAAGNVIMQRGRRGAANFVVTNWKVATMLQSNAQYAFSPIANTFNQNNGSLYPVGTIAGLTVYVDPLMHTQDTRVLVGRKGDKDEPQVVFCPYIMAESVRLITEGTASPKVLVKSRYALVDLGWYTQLNYLTFYVKTPEGIV
jgi:peptidoglycan hydrolase-like protein with peptidoglycan-binding domain